MTPLLIRQRGQWCTPIMVLKRLRRGERDRLYSHFYYYRPHDQGPSKYLDIWLSLDRYAGTFSPTQRRLSSKYPSVLVPLLRPHRRTTSEQELASLG